MYTMKRLSNYSLLNFTIDRDIKSVNIKNCLSFEKDKNFLEHGIIKMAKDN